jgi:hypothetical protein
MQVNARQDLPMMETIVQNAKLNRRDAKNVP